MSDYTSEIPYGYCHCGCGQKTKISTENRPKRGLIKGEPIRYVKGHTRKYSPERRIVEFWNKVNKDGSIPSHMPHLGKCWEWVASAGNTGGYGSFGDGKGKLIYAHRFSWLLNVGHIPDGLYVLHKCDNRKCVNPSHLFLGTYKDNAIDMFEKGRAKRAKEYNGRHKLTEVQVEEIRERYSQGNISQQKLADEYGISQSEVSYITTKTGWTD